MEEVTEVLHGVTVKDPYRWLEDQDSPETRAWIDRQNAYSRSVLDTLPGRDRIRARLAGLMKVEAVGIPRERAGRYFFTKRAASQNQAVLMMRKGLTGADEVLIDPTSMSADQTTSVTLHDVSRDGTWIVYGLRQGGQDETPVLIRDVDKRRDLPDRLPSARYSGIALKADKTGFFYGRLDKQGPRVFYHALGTSAEKEIFGRGYGPEYFISVELSSDGRYLLLQAAHGSAAEKVELYFKDAEHDGPITPIVNDIDARFEGLIGGDQCFLYTNWNAPNGKVLVADLKNPDRRNWRELVPESSAIMNSVSLAGGAVAVNYLENVKSKVTIFSSAGKALRDIQFPALGTVTELFGRWNSPEAFYVFTSFVQPPATYRYLVATGKQETWHQPNIPVDPGQFDTRQVWYPSKDNTRIPMFLVHKKGMKLDGNRPVLLTGYGGFSVAETPAWTTRAVIWAEAGGIYALPNLRGGGEFGEKWHRAGMLANKQNVFDDFIAAAEWLIENGYTRPSHLAIAGGSNGGLLAGAAVTQRPELFQAALCAVPLLDMLRFQKFLVARLWVSEYGSAEDPKQFGYIYKYSPYQQVREGVKYPAVLFVTGDSDTRVAPLHARKMTARMQAATGSDRPILLHYDTRAGHSAGLPITKQIADLTDQMSFLMSQTGAAATP